MTASSRQTDEPAVTPEREGSGLARSLRVRLDLGYDGTEFSGWAKQPGRRTVCGVLEHALSMVLREPVRLTVAGRTDAGVHASGQVAHLDLPDAVSATAPDTLPNAVPDAVPDAVPNALRNALPSVAELPRRLARFLPADVRVFGARVVPAEFDARFAALRRHYVYRVADAPYGAHPLRRLDTVSWPRPLDLDALNAASARLLGEHDFVAFCRRREGATTIRELQRLDWARDADGVLLAHVCADAFCHSMVRSLMGALLAVGEGRSAVDWPASLLAATTRPSTVTVAPPHGLTLVGVDYPADDELAARAEVTRNIRTGLH